MRFLSRTAPLGILLSCSVHAGTPAGTVATVEGFGYAQKGEIYYTRPNAGGTVRVNAFGQYKDSPPIPAFVKLQQNTRRHLKPNDVIEEGDVIQTTGDSWVKVLFDDDSVLDVGPGSLIQVAKFTNSGKDRSVFLKTLYGKFGSIVARPLEGPQKYQIATPSAIMGVRGTEFLVNVSQLGDPEKENRTKTEIVCLHGQVSVDVAKHNEKGLVYYQPVVVNPGSMFATSGVHGLAQEFDVRAMNGADLRKFVAQTSPQVNAFGTTVGSYALPDRMPGTGIAMKHSGDRSNPIRTFVAQKKSSGFFDSTQGNVARSLASASLNFDVPHEYRRAPGAFGGLRDTRKYTGPAPINLLPGNSSRVKLDLSGF